MTASISANSFLSKRITIKSLTFPLLLIGIWIANCSSVGAQTEDKQWKVAILIFDNVQIIDYTGPYEVFVNAASNNHPRFKVYTVAPKSGSITTIGGMTVVPDYELENCPQPDILILPGGWGVYETRKNKEVISWIKKNSEHAQVVLSVCNGAFFLSSAGLLDGLEATTVAGAIPRLQAEAKTCKVLRNKRFVDNGKIVTSAGLSSGVDASLHVISKVLSKGWAQRVALDMEYDWRPDSSFARAMLADQYLIPPYILPKGYREPISYEGGTDHWKTVIIVETDADHTQILETVNQTIQENQKYLNWTRIESEDSSDKSASHWVFKGKEGNKWNAIISAEPLKEQEKVQLTMAVLRIDD